MKRHSVILAGLLLAGSSASVQAADAGHGRQLHQKHCTSCHDDGVYTRANRRITTPGGLESQVRRCEQSLGLKWFDEDIRDVTAYLNDSYYGFE